MASSVDSQKLASKLKVEMWDHDPNATTAKVVTPDGGTTERWADLRDFEYFGVAAMSSNLTGLGITKLEIVAADDTAGTNTVVVKDSGVVAADAVGDWVWQECIAAEVAKLSTDNGYSSRYVAGRLTVSNAADEAVVSYVLGGATNPSADLTPETTIA